MFPIYQKKSENHRARMAPAKQSLKRPPASEDGEEESFEPKQRRISSLDSAILEAVRINGVKAGAFLKSESNGCDEDAELCDRKLLMNEEAIEKVPTKLIGGELMAQLYANHMAEMLRQVTTEDDVGTLHDADGPLEDVDGVCLLHFLQYRMSGKLRIMLVDSPFQKLEAFSFRKL